MILTTYKYIANGYAKSSVFNKVNGDFQSNLALFIVSFSFNYFSLTKLFYGIRFVLPNRFFAYKFFKD